MCLALLAFLLLLGLTTTLCLCEFLQFLDKYLLPTMSVNGTTLPNECVADTQKHSECEEQRALLLNVHDNLTRERGQFLELQRRTELLSKNRTELLKRVQGTWTRVQKKKKNLDTSLYLSSSSAFVLHIIS